MKRERPAYAVYNGKAIQCRTFQLACYRCIDNAGSGYVVDGKRVYTVSTAYRQAKPVHVDHVEYAVAMSMVDAITKATGTTS